MVVVFIRNLMRISRWSELSVYRVCQEHEVMREADANETLPLPTVVTISLYTRSNVISQL